MNGTNQGDKRETGLAAAFKALAIVLAVGVLALAAGHSAYTPNAGSVASPAYKLAEPARDEVPIVGVGAQATEAIGNHGQRMLAAGPGGIPVQEMQLQEAAKPMASPAQQEEPVATF